MDICKQCKKHKPVCKRAYKVSICNDCFGERKPSVNYILKKSIARSLRKNGYQLCDIGCNVQYLREWLEYNFTCNTNWDNFRKSWNICHVVEDPDPKKYWNWSNLYPQEFNCAHIDIEYIKSNLEKFKEEGSTTKWFSGEFVNSS